MNCCRNCESKNLRIAELEARVRWLEHELGLDIEEHQIARLRRRWGLSALQARILLLLRSAYPRGLARASLLSRLPGYERDEDRLNNISVHVWRLRQKMGAEAIASLPRFAVGGGGWGNPCVYALSALAMAEIDAALCLEAAA